ncbi:MAG: type I restriction enzyme HsdR N-terminal domain-containing protein [Alphaproteobacteria bacterium]
MSGTEAEARIKINKMLEEAGWRLCDNENGRKNVDLEIATKVRRNEQECKGAIDYLLLDSHNFPLCVLEAKKDSINPLSAKDQARAYAEAQGIRFVILSNSQIHYLWDIKSGNPQVITAMPSKNLLSIKKNSDPIPKI